MLEHRDFDLGAVRLHAVVAGPEHGPLVLLLHGFPEFWRGWRHQIGPLAEAGFRVLVPDQRGYNLSDKPRRVRDYALDRLVEDAVGLIAAAGRDAACVAGHDWGGLVAWWTAVRFPERLRRLAILNVPHPLVMRRHLLTDPEQRRRSHYVFKFQLPWLPERKLRRDDWRIAERNTRGSARPGAFDDREMAAYREAWSRPGAIRAMVHWYRAALRHPPVRVADPRVRVPTRILWGARDPFLGRTMVEPSLALCDQGSLEWFEEATHWLQHEEPERVSGELVRFFSARSSG
jgi:pimeloyl-ACP methyl ester carboxylesterase